MVETSPPTPARKKLFNFKHKAVRRTSSSAEVAATPDQKNEEESGKGLDLFKRSKEFFPRAIAEQSQERKLKKEGAVRRRKKRVAPEREEEKADAQKEDVKVDVETPPSAKRRKLPPRQEEDIFGVSDEEERKVPRPKKKTAAGATTSRTVTPPATRAACDSPPGQRVTDKGKAPEIPYTLTSPQSGSYNTAPVELSDDDNADVQPTPSRTTRGAWRAAGVNGGNSSLLSDEDDVVIDPVERSMTVRGEERADEAGGGDTFKIDDPFLAKHYKNALARRKATKEAANPTADPLLNSSTPRMVEKQEYKGDIVTVIVKSEIYGLKDINPMAMKIRMFTPLQKILGAFIDKGLRKHRDVSAEEAESMILVFNKTKMYPSTTLETLSLGLDQNGSLPLSSPGWDRGFSPTARTRNGTPMFLCYHEKVFQNKGIELLKVRAEGDTWDELNDGQDGDTGGGDEEEEEQATDSFRVFLTSGRGIEPVKLTAHSYTQVAQLIAIFRQQRQIGPDKNVTIRWDGEELAEGTTMADAEVEDEDVLDVHIN